MTIVKNTVHVQQTRLGIDSFESPHKVDLDTLAYPSGAWFAMAFIETPIFTSDVCALLNDEEHTALQQHLVTQPTAGPVIATPATYGRSGGQSRERASGALLA